MFDTFIQAQKEYCAKASIPWFIMSDGNCPKCRLNIFDNGYTLEEASNTLITMCPHCHKSFVD